MGDGRPIAYFSLPAGRPVAHALVRPAFTLSRTPRALWGRLPTCGRLSIGLLWGSQSWLQTAFSRLSSSRDSSVSAARDVPARDRLSLVGPRFSPAPIRVETSRDESRLGTQESVAGCVRRVEME